MRPATIIFISIALVLAGGAVMLGRTIIQNRAADAVADAVAAAEMAKRDVEVLVAGQDVPQGRVLKEADLRWDRWPINTANSGRYVIRDEAKGIMDYLPGPAVRRSLAAGEPITGESVFKPGDGGFMSGMIFPGQKAVGITVTAASTASGFVLPGDYVDVILTIDLRKADGMLPGGGRFASETILSGVRILAVDQSMVPGKSSKPKRGNNQDDEDEEELSIVGKTVAIEVTRKQAERVLAAQSAGSLSLALRSMALAEEQDSEASPFTVDVDMSEVLRAAIGGGVKIIKGGQVDR